jgi:RimJ/RimL family protein N-acetyltransferase
METSSVERTQSERHTLMSAARRIQADFSNKPTLVGQRVTLRPFIEADLPRMAIALADPQVRRLTGSVTSDAEANAEAGALDDATRQWYLTRNDTIDRLDLAIADNSTGLVVGESVLNEWDAESASCNFRILIGPEGRDRGLGSEATKLTLDYAFGPLGLSKVTLGVFAFNPRARHVYEKMGFQVTSIDRGGLEYNGEPVDDIAMAIAAAEHGASRTSAPVEPLTTTIATRSERILSAMSRTVARSAPEHRSGRD